MTDRLDILYGDLDCNLRLIEESLGVQLHVQGGRLLVEGQAPAIERAIEILRDSARLVAADRSITTGDVNGAIRFALAERQASPMDWLDQSVFVRPMRRAIAAKTPAQRRYLRAAKKNDVVFAIGPAGTGKTYLAVALALEALLAKRVRRLVLTRPAVEAGERLGFLPGDMLQKVNPYLRPLYDALHDLLDYDRVAGLMAQDQIEVAPLAFMRGRSLNESFIILDEAQNTTPQQMKMFLTRLGRDSRAIVTGDVTQIDLEGRARSGLVAVQQILRDVAGVGFVRLGQEDVVRNDLVRRIVQAYEAHEAGPAAQGRS